MSESSVRRARRELEQLLTEVADVDLRHPAWRGLLAVVARIEARGRAPQPALDGLYPTYLAADGGPRTDTFMGWERADLEAGGRAARALQRLRAAQAALAALEGSLPGQPLDRLLARERGWLVRRELPAGAPCCALVGPRGAALVRIDQDDGDLVRLLAAWEDGRGAPGLEPIDPRGRAATPAVLALGLVDVPRDRARHLHRQAWTRGGGPWLGLGEGEGLELLSTCHLAVDGYGHALLSGLVRERAVPVASPGTSPGAARSLAWRAIEPLGVAHAILETPPSFPVAAHAFGRALAATYLSAHERARARFTPTFQVPVAPGPAHARRARRVLHGLFSLRMQQGRVEGLEELRARLRPSLARELEGAGLLTRLLTATLRAPLPQGVRRRVLAARGRPIGLLPPVEVLGGRGRLSVLRLPEARAPGAPLLAVSAPPLSATRRDPRGGCVLTLLHGRGHVTATLSGTGLAGDAEGARRLLDEWRARVEAGSAVERRLA